MKNIARRFVQVLIAALLSACTLEMSSPISATAEQHINGVPLKTWPLSEMQARVLVDWFKQHPSGWSLSYASYVPRVMIRLKHANGKESSVNVLPPGLIVVSSIDGQFTQSFEARTVEQLVAIIGATGG